jgi:hypothetical protein
MYHVHYNVHVICCTGNVSKYSVIKSQQKHLLACLLFGRISTVATKSAAQKTAATMAAPTTVGQQKQLQLQELYRRNWDNSI